MNNDYEVVPFTQETLPPRFLDFVGFCENQHEDKEINHLTWSSCAIGAFLNMDDEVFDSLLSTVAKDEMEADCIRLIEETLGGFNNQLKANIGHRLVMTEECPDYGTFTKFIKQWLPKVDEVV